MKKLIAILLLTVSINTYADDFGLTPTYEVSQVQERLCDSPNGFACS